jgi:hypothetical protein
MQGKLNNERAKVKREKKADGKRFRVPMITLEGAFRAMPSQRHFL